MATTTNLKTRIKLKYDTLANWVANDPVLLQGEIALVDPGVTAADGSATVLIKVGRSGKKFSECPYLWANAADVPSWAKNGTKPEYTYSEIKNTPTIGNGTITINQGGTTKGTFTLNATGNTAINLSDANTTYKLVQDASDGHKIKLQASTDGGTTWTDVSDYITIPDNDHTYTAASLGLGSVVNKGMDSTPTASSTNYVTSGGVKSYVDKAIGDLTKFDIVKYDSFDKLPTTGVKGTIYIVPDSHSDSNDSYDEYL